MECARIARRVPGSIVRGCSVGLPVPAVGCSSGSLERAARWSEVASPADLDLPLANGPFEPNAGVPHDGANPEYQDLETRDGQSLLEVAVHEMD